MLYLEENKKVVVVGIPGVGKTTLINKIVELIKDHNKSVQVTNFGTIMFEVAKECGADAVKLQKRDNRSLYTRAAYAKPYDNRNSYGATYGEHREALEFEEAEYRDLFDYARSIGITMFSTAFDFGSADFLA